MRTDLHRPSVIKPEDYTFVACDYFGEHGRDMFAGDRMVLRAFMERTGARYTTHEHGGTCGVCGASAMYVARYHHRPTNTILTTGMDCAEKMDIADPVAFASAKKRVAAGRKVHAGKLKAEGLLAARNLQEAWAIYSATYDRPLTKDEGIVVDIVAKLVKYGAFASDKQEGFLRKVLGDIAERPAREARWAKEQAEKAARSRHVGQIGERITRTVKVTRNASFETRYGTMNVTDFEDADGNVIVYKGSKLPVARGDEVVLVGTVAKHDAFKGVAQTTVKRPIIKSTAVAEAVVLDAA